MAKIEVITEEESDRGWVYRAAIDRGPKGRTEHTIKLAWVDHEMWSGGRVPPSRVVEILLAFLVERESKREVPASFDAATVRRWFPDADRELAGRF